jgi:hypothetical protein
MFASLYCIAITQKDNYFTSWTEQTSAEHKGLHVGTYVIPPRKGRRTLRKYPYSTNS